VTSPSEDPSAGPAMDHDAKMEPSLVSSFFELGIMGIEVPEQWGGAGSTFFNAVLVVAGAVGM